MVVEVVVDVCCTIKSVCPCLKCPQSASFIFLLPTATARTSTRPPGTRWCCCPWRTRRGPRCYSGHSYGKCPSSNTCWPSCGPSCGHARRHVARLARLLAELGGRGLPAQNFVRARCSRKTPYLEKMGAASANLDARAGYWCVGRRLAVQPGMGELTFAVAGARNAGPRHF